MGCKKATSVFFKQAGKVATAVQHTLHTRPQHKARLSSLAIAKFPYSPFLKGHDLPCGSKVTALYHGEDFFSSFLTEAKAAKKEILIEAYWFAPDAAGRLVEETLLQVKRSKNINIQVSYDSFGSLSSNHSTLNRLATQGVSLKEYNPLTWTRFMFVQYWRTLLHRNHRKLIIVDDRVAFVGGFNIGKEWLPRCVDGDNWKDVMLKVTGPSVQLFRIALEAIHHRNTSLASPWVAVNQVRVPDSSVSDALWEVQNRTDRHARFHRAVSKVVIPSVPTSVSSAVQLIANQYPFSRTDITDGYLAAIGAARRSIILCHGYFLPNQTILNALYAAVKRGVSVSIILPRKSDIWLYGEVMKAYYDLCVPNGVCIYEYLSNTLHSKVATFDGEVSVVGSYNIDPLSRLSNQEIVAVVHSKDFTEDLDTKLQADIELHCEQVLQKRTASVDSMVLKVVLQGIFQLWRLAENKR